MVQEIHCISCAEKFIPNSLWCVEVLSALKTQKHKCGSSQYKFVPNLLILYVNFLGKNSCFMYPFSREQQKPLVKGVWSSPEEDGSLSIEEYEPRAEHRQDSALSDKRGALLQEGRAMRGAAFISSPISDEIMGQVWADHRDSFRSDRRQGWIQGCCGTCSRSVQEPLGPGHQEAGLGSGMPSL